MHIFVQVYLVSKANFTKMYLEMIKKLLTKTNIIIRALKINSLTKKLFLYNIKLSYKTKERGD